MQIALTNHVVQASGGVRYVAATGVDTGNDCTNSTLPCATIQRAVNAAAAGNRILVAAGTYTDIHVVQEMTQTVWISQSVTIEGGYTADFAAPPDPPNNPTTLDAGSQGRGISVINAGTVTLVGLQITGGTAITLNNRGGGIYIENTTAFLQDNVIFANEAEFGGGVYWQGGGGTFERNQVLNNTAGYGGGLYVQSSDIAVQDNVFEANAARFGGGGLRLYESHGALTGNEIGSNTAVLHGGGLYLSFSAATLTGNTIADNQITTADQGWGGGLQLHQSPALLQGNTILNNNAYYGGGLRLFQSRAILEGNLIQENQAAFGGGLSLEADSQAQLDNNVIVDNQVTLLGAGLYVRDAKPILRHTTIARNSGGDGSGVYITKAGEVAALNTIVFNQTVGVLNVSGLVTMTATLWDSNGLTVMGSIQETGSITGTAAFASDGYHLTASSDALNGGVDAGVTIDIDGQARPRYGGYDLGADEWQAVAVAKTANTPYAQAGDTVTYTVTFTNDTATTVTVAFTDVLPVAVSYLGPLVAPIGTGVYTAGVVAWSGTMPPATAVGIYWPVQVGDTLPRGTTITNVALVDDGFGQFQTEPAMIVIPYRVYLALVIHN